MILVAWVIWRRSVVLSVFGFPALPLDITPHCRVLPCSSSRRWPADSQNKAQKNHQCSCHEWYINTFRTDFSLLIIVIGGFSGFVWCSDKCRRMMQEYLVLPLRLYQNLNHHLPADATPDFQYTAYPAIYQRQNILILTYSVFKFLSVMRYV